MCAYKSISVSLSILSCLHSFPLSLFPLLLVLGLTVMCLMQRPSCKGPANMPLPGNTISTTTNTPKQPLLSLPLCRYYLYHLAITTTNKLLPQPAYYHHTLITTTIIATTLQLYHYHHHYPDTTIRCRLCKSK